MYIIVYLKKTLFIVFLIINYRYLIKLYLNCVFVYIYLLVSVRVVVLSLHIS